MFLKTGVFLGLVLFYFYNIHGDGNWDKYPDETSHNAFIKVLPILSLIFFTLIRDVVDANHVNLKQNVILGLLFSMIGDVFMVWRFDLLLPGMLFFAVAHVFYCRAFTFHPRGDTKTALTSVVPGVMAFFFLFLPNIEQTSLKIVGIIYSTLIGIMWWRALVNFRTKPSSTSLCACAGAFIFMTSDFIISVDNWLFSLPYASVLIMTTYYLAQYLITFSALNFQPNNKKIK